jgi:hypothetical protein
MRHRASAVARYVSRILSRRNNPLRECTWYLFVLVTPDERS